MEANPRQQKLDLVWASIVLAAFAMWGLTVLAFSNILGLQMVAVGMALGLLLSLVTVSVLFLFAGSGRGLLVLGRILVCLQLLCHMAAVVMGILVIARIS